ncbi:MAG TPA: hypothetical protein VFK86_05065 [Bauldia sp.]|nr:hypothetical protein [Bauldia sp.]
MLLKAIHAAAVSAAFVLAMGATSLSVQAETGTVDAFDQARCQEARNNGNAFVIQQFCATWEVRGMATNGRTVREALSLEEMNCASSTESNKIPCAAKGRI